MIHSGRCSKDYCHILLSSFTYIFQWKLNNFWIGKFRAKAELCEAILRNSSCAPPKVFISQHSGTISGDMWVKFENWGKVIHLFYWFILEFMTQHYECFYLYVCSSGIWGPQDKIFVLFLHLLQSLRHYKFLLTISSKKVNCHSSNQLWRLSHAM